MLNVVCVLRSGGEYWPEHVMQLRAGIARHLSIPHRFVCLSDQELDCETIRLAHRWPGWWSKIELFRPGLFDGPVFYCDLDTIIVGPIDDIVTDHRFTVLQNFWATDRIGSGIMAWSGSSAGPLSLIYERFCRDPARIMRDYVTTQRWGDQGWIRFNAPIVAERWQSKHPGRVVSFKFHVRPNGGVPADASIVAFHGRPRPFALPPAERAWFAEAA